VEIETSSPDLVTELMAIGVGSTHIQSFLATSNIPSPHNAKAHTGQKDMADQIMQAA